MLKYTFVTPDDNKYLVSAYYYEDRYRYTLTTERGIEYREVISESLSSGAGTSDAHHHRSRETNTDRAVAMVRARPDLSRTVWRGCCPE